MTGTCKAKRRIEKWNFNQKADSRDDRLVGEMVKFESSDSRLEAGPSKRLAARQARVRIRENERS